jgi:hypothetical protein
VARRYLADPPPNVEFTGFLQQTPYCPRIWNANAMVVLTTYDHTVLRGAWGAPDLGQPLVLANVAYVVWAWGDVVLVEHYLGTAAATTG